MNKETLLAELNLLLDAGEPLLTLFPRHPSYDWLLQLPDNMSDDMEWYADSVSKRSWDRTQFQDLRPEYSTEDLAWLVKKSKAGLLGWRAVGAI